MGIHATFLDNSHDKPRSGGHEAFLTYIGQLGNDSGGSGYRRRRLSA
jgi:hypothetical protein